MIHTFIILKLIRSTKMQYVIYPPSLFYNSFSQYTTYVNILTKNEIPIFLFSIATKYTFLGLHFLVQCTYFAMTGRYWNLYVILIHTLDTGFIYWIWQMTYQLNACTMYFHIQYCATTYTLHSNHKILSFKKIVHTVKPQLSKLVYRSRM